MRTINLYFDFEFTSLSPDAQPISLGIVSDEIFDSKYQHLYKGDVTKSNCSVDHLTAKSFYAEFTDFDINRCDAWVKENVVSKLSMYGKQEPVENYEPYSDDVKLLSTFEGIKQALTHWLHQFSEYEVEFVCDCGTYDWYWMVQLIGEWEVIHECSSLGICEVFQGLDSGKCPVRWYTEHTKAMYEIKNEIINDFHCMYKRDYKTGLPKLPSNISPVPFDLNDLIAIKKGISAREAFELNREELAFGRPDLNDSEKHNALIDAQVIKTIYNKLK